MGEGGKARPGLPQLVGAAGAFLPRMSRPSVDARAARVAGGRQGTVFRAGESGARACAWRGGAMIENLGAGHLAPGLDQVSQRSRAGDARWVARGGGVKRAGAGSMRNSHLGFGWGKQRSFRDRFTKPSPSKGRKVWVGLVPSGVSSARRSRSSLSSCRCRRGALPYPPPGSGSVSTRKEHAPVRPRGRVGRRREA